VRFPIVYQCHRAILSQQLGHFAVYHGYRDFVGRRKDGQNAFRPQNANQGDLHAQTNFQSRFKLMLAVQMEA
jgi:hypothetical protein